MACFSPLKAYRKSGGEGITFSPREGHFRIDLPCGQCIGCRIERSRQWGARCVHEARLHEHNAFVTLTYDQAHLPENGSLNVRDWQLFAKRLRKRTGPFRYFMCGEYGGRRNRPHYHAILFGCDLTEGREPLDSSNTKSKHPLYLSPKLSAAWTLGAANYGECNYTTAQYCAKYIIKKKTGPQSDLHYARFDKDGNSYWLKPEFALMSRGGRGKGKGGIASEWFEKYKSDVYPTDEVVIDGKRFRPPRFYDSKLSDEELAVYRKTRRARVAARAKDLTPERLAVSEKIAIDRERTFASREKP